jgi:aryl-alcohol dehydrogenase-like predicted oxidoreductase
MSLPQRRLGRTNLTVSALGFGCFQYTGEFNVPQSEAARILDVAAAANIRLVDTAAMYGFGESEELLGRAMQRHPKWRPVVSTKVGWLDRTVVRKLGDAAYQNEDAILRAIMHSLWLLRRDSIEILMIHEPDWKQWGLENPESAPVLRVLERLKREKIIGAIGVGGWKCNVIADLIETGRIDVALVAGGFSLASNDIYERVIPAAKKHETGIIAAASMVMGALSVKDRPRIEGKIAAGDRVTFHQRALRIYDLSDECGIDLPSMTVRYLLSFPDLHTHIPGAREAWHLENNLTAVKAGPLPPAILSAIEEINSETARTTTAGSRV